MLLLLFLLSNPVLGQETIGCFVDGECENGIFINAETDIPDSNACLVSCNSTSGCNYFTYQTPINACIAYSTCPSLSTESCPDCISGRVDCQPNRCFYDGQCVGVAVDFSEQTSKEACRERCLGNLECNFFTFNSDGGLCVLTRNCTVDLECETCVYGGRICQAPYLSKILVVGGWNSGYLRDVELIDMASPIQDCVKPADFPRADEEMKAAMIDGAPWVCGSKSLSTDCYSYDGKTNTWNVTARMLQVRSYFSATMINGGADWWLTGGRGNGTPYLDSTEVLRDGRFVKGTDLPEPMWGHCVVAINNTHVFLAGGVLNSTHAGTNQAYIINFDDTGSSWQRIQNMSISRYEHTCNLITTSEFGVEIVVTGGHVSTTEIYSLTDERWRQGPSFHESILQHQTVTYRDSFLLIGGYNGQITRDYIYSFNKEEWRWEEQDQTLNVPRDSSALIMLEDDMTHCNPNRD